MRAAAKIGSSAVAKVGYTRRGRSGKLPLRTAVLRQHSKPGYPIHRIQKCSHTDLQDVISTKPCIIDAVLFRVLLLVYPPQNYFIRC